MDGGLFYYSYSQAEEVEASAEDLEEAMVEIQPLKKMFALQLTNKL